MKMMRSDRVGVTEMEAVLDPEPDLVPDSVPDPVPDPDSVLNPDPDPDADADRVAACWALYQRI